jgi:hypothetical protein
METATTSSRDCSSPAITESAGAKGSESAGAKGRMVKKKGKNIYNIVLKK